MFTKDLTPAEHLATWDRRDTPTFRCARGHKNCALTRRGVCIEDVIAAVAEEPDTEEEATTHA